MAVESKPLFHPEVVRQELRSFKLPARLADSMPKLQHWADLIASGRADDFKETDLLPDFITDLFCHLPGYTRPAGPTDTFTLSREKHVEVDGQIADGPFALSYSPRLRSPLKPHHVTQGKNSGLHGRARPAPRRP